MGYWEEERDGELHEGVEREKWSAVRRRWGHEAQEPWEWRESEQ